MRRWVWLAALVAALSCATARDLATIDFRDPAVAAQWRPRYNAELGGVSADGLVVKVTGEDPGIVGPTIDLPAGVALWATLRFRSSVAGATQLFWDQHAFNPTNACHFDGEANRWNVVRVALPPMGPGTMLRLDPPGGDGGETCVFASLTFSECRQVAGPAAWPKPTVPTFAAHDAVVSCGDLSLRCANQLGAYELTLAGQRLAVGYNHALIVYEVDEHSRFVALDQAKTRITRRANTIEIRGTVTDPDGGRWTIVNRFAPCPVRSQVGEARGQGIWATAEVSCDAARAIGYLPTLTIFPGVGTPGATRDKGLLAGAEYLDAPDTSSSEADFTGRLAWRQATDTKRLTQPLMAVSEGDAWIALAWQPQADLCAVFDTPDRLYGGGGSVMGLLFPGSDGANRAQNSLTPYEPVPLPANRRLTVRGVYYGGRCTPLGATDNVGIIGAEQTWLAAHPLPPLPKVDRAAYLKTAAHAWLSSAVREKSADGHLGAKFKHAFYPGANHWQPAVCGDAPYFIAWLATRVDDPQLKAELAQLSADALAVCPKRAWSTAGVSHVASPLSPLLFGGVAEMVDQQREVARNSLNAFAPDGSRNYAPLPGKSDYGRTHFEKTANGYIAPSVATLLQAALLTGDAQMKADGLRLLHTLDRYDGSVPRGAQTWECPLHSPDILASAYLVKAYVEGYELSGDESLLRRALYWAWTGVPFVHLAEMVPGHAGPFDAYATTAVYCSTNWVGVPWLDRPVQWCGLVYAAALRRLAVYAPAGPWRRLADGIALSGIRQSYPDDNPLQHGLLPDSYWMGTEKRVGPAINPGTVESAAMYLDDTPYDYRVARAPGLTVFCAGAIHRVAASPNRLAVDLSTWRPGSLVYVVGADASWSALADGHQVDPQRGLTWLAVPAQHTLVLQRQTKTN